MTTDGQSTNKFLKSPLLVVGVLILVSGIVIFGRGSPFANTAAIDSSDPIVVRFLIAHQPISVFEKANTVFRNELERLSDGSMTLEVYGPGDFGINDRDISKEEVYALMDSGDIHLSTSPVTVFSKEIPETDIFLLPFVFDSYESILTFFDGKEAENILDSVSQKTRLHAMTFTFSGGFRVLALKDNVNNLSQLYGKKIASLGSDITKATLEAFGAEAISVGPDTVSADVANADGVEVAYTRFPALQSGTSMQSIIETNANVLVTMIVADDSFYRSLSEEQQGILKQVAIAAAIIERESSISLANKTRESLIKNGVQVIELSESQKKDLKENTKSVIETYRERVGDEILNTI
jgi:TRAP-type C4-dicarboxylate transport system substrate-binding protein